ncbi:MAG TPA: ROK family protein [Oscillospiraceae bacterium]|nr:ROK family protein [Oscillospiraceae bacterium]HPF55394.1 ROK family protein [Clostridiales bacterium]HPK35606.1 ROK family protein [Oscillospiraceae bacterium]HPR74670.1 ROK family protein [Oscillospiraceae bacterium]
MKQYISVDIGGTKCAVSLWRDGNPPEIVKKIKFATLPTPEETIALLVKYAKELSEGQTIDAVGISCGGPLDSKKGLILCPPNLPNWTNIDIVTPLQNAVDAPAFLQNDANACALAEWLWGAGKGYQNVVFLTFGTGMGSGLILDGKLYSGTNDMGGEVGHMRIADDGPVGYGKRGSFEGYCSGGGIARLAQERMPAYLKTGKTTLLKNTEITAKSVSDAADAGDEFALSVIEECGEKLGIGLSNIIDIINPELIVIGSIYGREPRFAQIAERVIAREALPFAAAVCRIVYAGLGESVGDYAAVAAARYGQKQTKLAVHS